MILGFKTQVKGKPTHFVEKILAGVEGISAVGIRPKIHTIRGGNRWRGGYKIHMATGVRTKQYLCFNTGITALEQCRGVQSINIIKVDDLPRKLYDGCVYEILIPIPRLNETFSAAFRVRVDGRFLTVEEIKKLAVNDGFENPEQLFWWFDLQDFNGQLIHWTDYKY